MAELTDFPADTHAAITAACKHLSGGGVDVGVDCSLVLTHETIEEFDAAHATHWISAGSRTGCLFDCRPAVQYSNFQRRARQPRENMIVVDCGAVRAVLQ